MLDIILEIFAVLGIYDFLLVAFALIITKFFKIKSLSEIASTIALIVMLVLSIIIIEFLSSKINKFSQENKEDKMLPAYWNIEDFSDYVRRIQGISKKTKWKRNRR